MCAECDTKHPELALGIRIYNNAFATSQTNEPKQKVFVMGRSMGLVQMAFNVTFITMPTMPLQGNKGNKKKKTRNSSDVSYRAERLQANGEKDNLDIKHTLLKTAVLPLNIKLRAQTHYIFFIFPAPIYGIKTHKALSSPLFRAETCH